MSPDRNGSVRSHVFSLQEQQQSCAKHTGVDAINDAVSRVLNHRYQLGISLQVSTRIRQRGLERRKRAGPSKYDKTSEAKYTKEIVIATKSTKETSKPNNNKNTRNTTLTIKGPSKGGDQKTLVIWPTELTWMCGRRYDMCTGNARS